MEKRLNSMKSFSKAVYADAVLSCGTDIVNSLGFFFSFTLLTFLHASVK